MKVLRPLLFLGVAACFSVFHLSGRSFTAGRDTAAGPLAGDMGTPMDGGLSLDDCKKTWGVKGYSLLDIPANPSSGFHPNGAQCPKVICVPERGTYVERPYCTIENQGDGDAEWQYTAIMVDISATGSSRQGLTLHTTYDDGSRYSKPIETGTWYVFGRKNDGSSAKLYETYISAWPFTGTPLPTIKRLRYDLAKRAVTIEDCPTGGRDYRYCSVWNGL